MMNEQSSKKILFNKSSLLSLKAELYKKQEEVIEKKQLPQHKVPQYKPPPARKKEESDGGDKEWKKSFRDNLKKEVDIEELEACRKSKAMLEKKVELYEHLSDGAGHSQLAERFLVDFRAKKNEAANKSPSPKDEEDAYNDDDDDGDEEWTEFKDCLGRTRKCLKSDLHRYIEKDKKLSKDIFKEKPEDAEPDAVEDPPIIEVEKPLLVKTTNDYLQSLREKWEQKENELLAKEKDIHYQDLLFDEARQHGVAYYSFSTDDTERRRQMEELVRRRQETLRAQKETEETRRKREELIAGRAAAARARQRARAGLPPEEPQDNSKDFAACLLELLTKQRDEADAEAKEKEKKIREEKEKERQKLREAYVREWDVGKDGVEKPKGFREMTQEEYVEQQRSKRIDEFAPQGSKDPKESRFCFDDKGRKVAAESKTWAEVRPPTKCPSPVPEVSDQKGLYFSTSAKATFTKGNTMYANFVRPQPTNTFDEAKPVESESSSAKQSIKYRNFVGYQESTSTYERIVNEVEDDTSNDMSNEVSERDLESTKEMAPPPTYEYYGPVPKRLKAQKPFSSDMNEAYVQGSKSLEPKTLGRKISRQYDFSLE